MFEYVSLQIFVLWVNFIMLTSEDFKNIIDNIEQLINIKNVIEFSRRDRLLKRLISEASVPQIINALNKSPDMANFLAGQSCIKEFLVKNARVEEIIGIMQTFPSTAVILIEKGNNLSALEDLIAKFIAENATDEELQTLARINQQLIDVMLQLLSPYQQLIIKDKLKNNYKLTHSAKKRLLKFEESTEPLFYDKINRKKAFQEICEILSEPHKIDQGPYGLCGVAAFINVLAEAAPSTLAFLACDIAESGTWHGGYLLVTANIETKNKNKTVVEAVLHAIRHSMNTTGYSAGFFDPFRVFTSAFEICRWLTSCGFTDVRIESGKPSLKNLERICQSLQENKKVIMIITGALADKIMENRVNHSFSALLLGHAVLVNHLEIIRNNSQNQMVKIEMSTWGQKKSNQIKLEEFLEGYDGAIQMIPPTEETALVVENELAKCRVM